MVRIGLDPTQVHEDARVVALVRARQRDQRPGGPVAAGGDLDLRARKVKLCPVRSRGQMQGDVLDAEEVLAAGSRSGDGRVRRLVLIWKADFCQLPSTQTGLQTTQRLKKKASRTLSGPGHLLVLVHGRHLCVELEPDSAGAVPSRR